VRLGSLEEQSGEVRTENSELFTLFVAIFMRWASQVLAPFLDPWLGTHNSRGIVVFSLFLKKVIITPHPSAYPLHSSSITSLDTRRTEAFSRADISSLVFQHVC